MQDVVAKVWKLLDLRVDDTDQVAERMRDLLDDAEPLGMRDDLHRIENAGDALRRIGCRRIERLEVRDHSPQAERIGGAPWRRQQRQRDQADRIEYRRRVDPRGEFAGGVARRHAQPFAVRFVARRAPIGTLPVEKCGQR